MIRFDQVYKRYPNGRDALAGVSFDIEAGELGRASCRERVLFAV